MSAWLFLFHKCTKARAKQRGVRTYNSPMGSANENRRAPLREEKQEEKRGGDERGKTAAPAIINPSIKTIDPNQSLC